LLCTFVTYVSQYLWIASRDRVFGLMTGFIGLFDTARDYTLQFTVTHTHYCPVTPSLPLFGSGFQQRTNCPWPQLPATNSNSSQWLNPSSSLTPTQVEVKVKVMLWPTVSRRVYPAVKHPSGAQDQISITVRQLQVCWCEAPSLTRGWICRLKLLLALASAIILGSESRGTHDHILQSHIRDSPNLEGQVPVFISPRNRVLQLYSQALGSLFVASYGSQDYGGGIWTRLHAGFWLQMLNWSRL
jgi:hypothetical protein